MTENKRIYISGGITGIPDYMTKFSDAETELIDRGYTSIINPAFVNSFLPKDMTHADYMEVSMAELKCCNAIYMLRGWKRSTGAVMEYHEAINRKMEIIYQ